MPRLDNLLFVGCALIFRIQIFPLCFSSTLSISIFVLYCFWGVWVRLCSCCWCSCLFLTRALASLLNESNNHFESEWWKKWVITNLRCVCFTNIGNVFRRSISFLLSKNRKIREYFLGKSFLLNKQKLNHYWHSPIQIIYVVCADNLWTNGSSVEPLSFLLTFGRLRLITFDLPSSILIAIMHLFSHRHS